MAVQSDGATLPATVVEPVTAGPHPAVVVVHGAGRETGSRYRSVADQLVAGGYVSLVYDKRGVGDSTDTYSGVGPLNSERVLGELATDALACLEALRARSIVNPERTGLLGFSQAGWIIPLAASRSSHVAFMVLVSGSGVSVGENILYEQIAGGLPGAPPSSLPREKLEAELRAYPGPFGFDPVPALRATASPGLWLLGAEDKLTPVFRTVPILEELVRNEGKPFAFRVYPNGDHGLRDVTTGKLQPYLRDALDWLRGRGIG